MGTQITLDDDVRNELVDRAIKLDMVFSPLNDVLRVVLGMNGESKEVSPEKYPHSRDKKVQKMLDGLRDAIYSLSPGGMILKRKRWVANPNIVTITVQDARAHNLRLTVYGKPEEFKGIASSIEVNPDMSGYSRFTLQSENQIPSAIKVIQHSFELKQARGRM